MLTTKANVRIRSPDFQRNIVLAEMPPIVDFIFARKNMTGNRRKIEKQFLARTV